MEELLKQLKEKALEKRKVHNNKVEASELIGGFNDIEINIINNRIALILGSIVEIESHLEFLNNRYGS